LVSELSVISWSEATSLVGLAAFWPTLRGVVGLCFGGLPPAAEAAMSLLPAEGLAMNFFSADKVVNPRMLPFSLLFGVFLALFSFLEAAECSATKAFIAEAGFLL
jgi:hypothetical protein